MPANLYAAKPDVIYDVNLKYAPKVYKVKKGDGLSSILRRHGFTDSMAKKGLGTHPFTDDFRFIKDQKYLVLKSRSNSDIKVRFYCPYSSFVYTVKKSEDKLSWEKETATLDIQVQYASGKVVGSLFQSITSKIPDDRVAYRFMDAYHLDYKLPKGIQRNAAFSLHIEKQYDEGQFIRYGEVLNTTLEYRGKLEERRFIRYPGGGTFVSPQDNHGDRPLYSPVNYLKISSTYKPRRFHPIKRRTIAHLGIDYVLPKGAPIVAPASGIVVKKGKTRAAGRYVVVEHKNGLKTFYNHMSAIDNSIRKGKRIKAGDAIGSIGCTGYCTLPHLHFAVKKHNRYIDPAKVTRSYPYSQKHLFESRKLY